jgi:hypothetical protein
MWATGHMIPGMIVETNNSKTPSVTARAIAMVRSTKRKIIKKR